ncbi:hypothetical protein DA075_06635 [Methylobacterium currus]|uniref:Uncharacterized protein n=1 Tax=Methylobacterium currus TaxID=2051553 RepID=A0A2R4WGI7_9HYPH|nr:hypothetical protein [Methylobacterium currus]AWB20640.1 hypothetical protein DA075_06635 [Methylobacterium currus]
MAVMLRDHTNISSGALDARATSLANEAKIAHALFTGIVKDKIGYPVREYAKNAWEVSPADRPFEIDLPGRWSPKIRFRDYGPGLDHEFIMERYATLGDSTKDSNGIGGVSGWGFGSLSALAYLMEDGLSGSFTVISYQGGEARHYIVSLDERGMPQPKHFASFPSEEPDGLEVSFAVREDDFEAFEDRAREILWSFEPRPVISPAINFREPEIQAQGQGWISYAKHTVPFSGPQVKVGPVMYPIDMKEISGSIGFLQPTDTIVFSVNPEDVTPTASREQLQYTSTTKRALSAMIAAFEANFVAEVQAKVDAASCYFEGCAVFRTATAHLGVNRISGMREKVTWGGQPIRTEITHKVMRLGDGWSKFERFSKDHVDPANVPAAAKIVVEHNPYASLDRFLALDLVGQDILWARVKRDELPGFLTMCALKEDDVIVLDKADVTRKANGATSHGISRNNRIRRRRALNVSLVPSKWGGTDVALNDTTETFDLAAGGLKIQRARFGYSRRADGFRIADGMSKLGEGALRALIAQLVHHNVIREDFRLLIDTGDDELDEDVWFDFGDYVEMRLRDLIDIPKLTPVQRQKGVGDIPHGILHFAERYDLEKAPNDLKTFATKVRLTKNSIQRRDERRENENDALFKILMTIVPGLHFPIGKAGVCPVDGLKENYDELMSKYPLFKHLLDGFNNTETNRRLGLYFDLLANQK